MDVTTLPVRFTGARAATGPLTFGQRNTLNWVGQEANEFSAVIHWVLALPDGVTLADIAAAFAVLMARHEALRTNFVDGEQRVRASGELAIQVHPLDDSLADTEAVDLLVGRLRAGGIDFRSELPLRVAIGVRDGVPRVGVVVYSHLAVDFGSMVLIGGQFTTLAADPASRVVEAEPGHQPLDQAAIEQSPRGMKAAEAALRHWESHLRTAPQSLYPMPLPDTPGEGLRTGILSSPAAGLALSHVSMRTKASRQVIVARPCALCCRGVPGSASPCSLRCPATGSGCGCGSTSGRWRRTVCWGWTVLPRRSTSW